VSSQQLINELLRLLPVGPRLNEMYMTAVASADYRRIVYGNPIFEGEDDLLWETRATAPASSSSLEQGTA
jgi:hypothetical protein